jgi:hypothetical protein
MYPSEQQFYNAMKRKVGQISSCGSSQTFDVLIQSVSPDQLFAKTATAYVNS